jgi:hypothetical protein
MTVVTPTQKDYDKGRVLPAYTIKTHRQKRGIAPLIFKLGIRWKQEVNFMLWPLNPHEMSLNPSTH